MSSFASDASIRVGGSIVLAAAALSVAALRADAAERSPRNPFLADSSYSLGHGDSAQQDALAVAGPSDPGAAFELRSETSRGGT